MKINIANVVLYLKSSLLGINTPLIFFVYAAIRMFHEGAYTHQHMPLSMNDNQHVQYSTVIRANELLYTTKNYCYKSLLNNICAK